MRTMSEFTERLRAASCAGKTRRVGKAPCAGKTRRVGASLLATLIFTAGLGVGLSPLGAAPIDDARTRAADARGSADAAAQRYETAIGRSEELGQQIEEHRVRIAKAKDEIKILAVVARRRAVLAYTGRNPMASANFLVNGGDPLDQERATKMLAKTKAADDAAMKRLSALNDDLAIEKQDLETAKVAQEDVVRQVEAEQVAVQAQLAEAQKALNELEAQYRREQEAAKAREMAANAARSGSKGNGRDYSGVYIVTGIVCPVRGGVSFIDSWGYPRHQGPHQGVDLMAAAGTPNVAVTNGTVSFRSGATSGLGAFLNGDDGNTYHYFHLSAFEGGGRRVSKGEVIGYVGKTGDAQYTATHTHFEIHPGGGPAVNPYPSVRPVC